MFISFIISLYRSWATAKTSATFRPRRRRSRFCYFEKYIFPHSMLPSSYKIIKAVQPLFVLEDWHNFGAYYDPTLMAWYRNFERNWDKLSKQYDKRFKRMWSYYLLACAGAFRARRTQLWQIVFSKKGIPGGYTS